MLIKETNFLLKWYKLIKAGFKSVAGNADFFSVTGMFGQGTWSCTDKNMNYNAFNSCCNSGTYLDDKAFNSFNTFWAMVLFFTRIYNKQA